MTARYAHSLDATRVAAVEKLDGLFSSKDSPESAPEAEIEGQSELRKPIQVKSLGS